MNKSEENCRQIYVRAKRHVDAGKRRYEALPAKVEELAEQFFAACERGELGGLVDLLATDAAFYGDGGGKAFAARRPVRGRERVARFLVAIFAKFKAAGMRLRRVRVNGQPGSMLVDANDRIVCVLELEVVDGAIDAMRSVVNPDKLRHLGPVSDFLTGQGRARRDRSRRG